MYTLEPYKSPSSRHTCPSCGAHRQFARYINTETSEYLADHVGRCNREQNCSYHYTPKQYFYDHPEFDLTKKDDFKLSQSNPTRIQVPSPAEKGFRDEVSYKNHNPPSLIPESIFHNSLSKYKHNHFITFLKSIFDPSTVTQLINTYFIGTSKNWPGSTVFWQIDFQGNIRDGKIMLYDPTTGRRVKQPYNHITWAHSALKLKDYNLQQCFFGEHLLKLCPSLPISIVESEKTAIIASVYFPQFIWLATGGKHGCKWTSDNVSTVLTGRHITLWPDIKAYNDWKLKADELSKSGLQVTISNLLEQVATEIEREAGLDIADYLVRFKPDQFADIKVMMSEVEVPVILSQPTPTPQHSILPLYQPTPIESHPSPFLGEGKGVRSWSLEELESFFSSTLLPEPPINLNQCTTILDLPKFISGHLAILRTYNGNPTFLPYLQRLQKLQEILISAL
jgi:hypothetical protein